SLGDAYAGPTGDPSQVDRDERRFPDPAAEPRAQVLPPAPRERAEPCDVLHPAAALDAAGESEPHHATGFRFEPGVRPEPCRERRGIDHEPPDVRGRCLDDLLVDLGRALASVLRSGPGSR